MAPRMAPAQLDELDAETAALVEGAGGLNIFATLARHPKALKRWLVFGSHVLAKSTLPARERELLILRVGWRCGSEYEFGQHTVIGQSVGITAEEVRRLASEHLDGWSDDDAMWIRAADELVADHVIGDQTWAQLAERLSDEQVIDLLFTVGQYAMVSMALKTLGVEREAGVPGWPT
ncbi:MAG TPA: carboxymuconolactone decarboxylase family protein [Aquihabitans sp.]|nr:carboxymuconolactone decarboxylase family protein [Aquihabitans sp.]